MYVPPRVAERVVHRTETDWCNKEAAACFHAAAVHVVT
jgi:hypothetical protein